MHKKLFLLVLIPASLVIMGYLFLRFSLQSSIKKEEKKTNTIVTNAADTLGGKKVSVIDLRPLFIKRMQLLLKKSSNGLYNLSVGDLTIDVLSSVVSLHDVQIKPDEKKLDSLKQSGSLPENSLSASFKSLIIEGINLDDAITSKTMDYKLVKLVNPVINIHIYKKEQKKNTSEDFSQRFLKEMEKLDIKKLIVEGGTITAFQENNNKSTSLNNVQVNMTGILLDSSTRTDKKRFLFSKESTISFQHFITQVSNGLYQLKVGSGIIRSPQQQVTLRNFSLSSSLSKAEFEKREKVSKELYNVSFASMQLNGVNWWTLFNAEEIIADQMEAGDGKITIYLDRSLPPFTRLGNFPNQLIMKMPIKMRINQLALRNIDLVYTEFNPVSTQEGTVYFDNVNMKVKGISNIEGNRAPMVVNGTALFMHKVPLQASFRFDMNKYRTGNFTATLTSTTPFDGSLLNSITAPLALMKVEKGTLQKLEANISGDQSNAQGDVLVLYKDLKLTLLEKDKGKKVLDKKDVTTFLANVFVIKNENPKEGKEPRKERAQFKRDPKAGFCMLVWKTVFVGVLKTIGAPEKLAYKKGADATK